MGERERQVGDKRRVRQKEKGRQNVYLGESMDVGVWTHKIKSILALCPQDSLLIYQLLYGDREDGE